MFLASLKYDQFEGSPQRWRLAGCTLGDINLIVGNNATGKSRTLNVIHGLADLLSGDRKLTFLSGNYRVVFDDEGHKVKYTLRYEKGKVVRERLVIDSKTCLQRTLGGKGKIRYEKAGGQPRLLEFQIPDNEIAVSARRDLIQHPFLEDLYLWGKSVTHYSFGTQLGKGNLLALLPTDRHDADQPEPNPKDTGQVVLMFRKAKALFGQEFTNSVVRDMRKVGFRITDVGTKRLADVTIQPSLPAQVIALYVKEADLHAATDQHEMSQGMFRALSLIIQITYSQLAMTPTCILIDDIGEGLDYERSSALVNVMINKTKRTPVQLVMATNDRFVMNKVPLRYWSVIRRIGGTSRIQNYRNSRELFEDFELTGLNNFDFFSSKYYLRRRPKQ